MSRVQAVDALDRPVQDLLGAQAGRAVDGDRAWQEGAVRRARGDGGREEGLARRGLLWPATPLSRPAAGRATIRRVAR